MTVFLLQHVRPTDDGEGDVKDLGIYSSEAKANEAVERFRLLPGFRDVPDGFSIDGYEIDEDHWTEGYISAEEATQRDEA